MIQYNEISIFTEDIEMHILDDSLDESLLPRTVNFEENRYLLLLEQK
jgi:hypothetical protein